LPIEAHLIEDYGLREQIAEFSYKEKTGINLTGMKQTEVTEFLVDFWRRTRRSTIKNAIDEWCSSQSMYLFI
jgi:hypothetical protein